MDSIGIFFSAVVLATAVEAVLEYVFGIWWKPCPEDLRPKILMAVGLVLGVGLCLWYQVDLIAELTGFTNSIVGQIITGAIVGRGSSFVHDILKKVAKTRTRED